MKLHIPLYIAAALISIASGFFLYTCMDENNVLINEPIIVQNSLKIGDEKTSKLTDNIAPIYIEEKFTLKRGETLTDILHRAGVSNNVTANAVYKLQRQYKVQKLRPGQKILIQYSIYKGEKDTLYFDNLSFYGPDDKHIKVQRTDTTEFTVDIKDRILQIVQTAVYGEINDSLYASAKKAKLPAALVPAFANVFSWEIDFTRDIRPGDSFGVVYERILDENGNFLRSGKVIAATLNTKKKTYDAYRWKNENGFTEYYSAKGFNKKRTLLRTPLEFTRISSHFNLKRKHPILGYTRAHKGTDFAAPTGTPIKAAGDGVIEVAKWNGGYGRYIKIKHDKKFKSSYAHMHRFAKGMRKGKKVRQGQIIGYVGTTGRSTGPHLHYELHAYGKPVNPLRVKLPTSKQVVKRDRTEFDAFVTKQLVAINAVKPNASTSE